MKAPTDKQMTKIWRKYEGPLWDTSAHSSFELGVARLYLLLSTQSLVADCDLIK